MALDTVADPPAMDKAKSLASSDPLPPVALYTASLMVTAIVVLSEAKATPVIEGSTAPSIMSALFAPREFVAAGAAKVNVAALPTASTMEPLFNANAVVLR